MERFYYKNKDNTGFLNLKSPLVDENYIQITKEEFNELTKPKEPVQTKEQKTLLEISKLKRELAETEQTHPGLFPSGRHRNQERALRKNPKKKHQTIPLQVVYYCI